MARALKASGLATNLVFCLAADTDGTIKEWVSPSVNSAKTMTGVLTGTATWKGASLGYWNPNGGEGIVFPSGSRPLVTAQLSVVALMVDAPAVVAGNTGLIDTTSVGSMLIRGGSESTALAMVSEQIGYGTATQINSTRSFGVGFTMPAAGGTSNVYYGLESGSAAIDDSKPVPTRTGADVGAGVTQVGKSSGRGAYNAKYVLFAMFNKALTLVEHQSLHDDPMGALFDEVAAVQNLAGNATGASAATGGFQIDIGLGGAGQGQSSATGSLDASPPLAGFDLHTAPGMVFGDLAGALTGLARQSAVNISAYAYNTSTGALVANSAPVATDAGGRLPRWTHASLVAATQYRLLFVRQSDGEVCAARMTAT